MKLVIFVLLALTPVFVHSKVNLRDRLKNVLDRISNRLKDRLNDQRVKDFENWLRSNQNKEDGDNPGIVDAIQQAVGVVEDRITWGNPEAAEASIMDRNFGVKDDKHYQHEIYKREARELGGKLYTEMSSELSPMKIMYVQPAGDRAKRSLYWSNSYNNWPHKIPVVFDSSYVDQPNGALYVQAVFRVFKRYSERLCVTFHDVTDTFDPDNPNWFTENGFETNSYMEIQKGSGCGASVGPGSTAKDRYVSPCNGFHIITHEIGHALGAAHMHQAKLAQHYLTLSPDSMPSGAMGSYKVLNDLTEIYFDPASAMLYGDWAFGNNGKETYLPMRDDLFSPEYSNGDDQVIFRLLNQDYKCNELYCNNSNVDCGLGYHTLYEGVCQCVCPPDFDPANNCQTLISSGTNKPWPNTPAVIFAGGPDNSCPTGFQQGWVSFTGAYPTLQLSTPQPMPNDGNTIHMPFCVKDGPQDFDWEDWPPGGRYCIIKPVGHDCGGAFQDFTLDFQAASPIKSNGSFGDIGIDNDNIKLRICCRKTEDRDFRLNLPNDKPFRVFAKDKCPRVEGMREYHGLIDFFPLTASSYGSLQNQHYILHGGQELQTFQCYFLPPNYGCNEQIILDSGNTQVTRTTPGFETSRPANTRCLYHISAPEGSRILVTFNTFDLDSQDAVRVRRFHKYQEAHRLDNAMHTTQFITEKNFLLLDFWTAYMDASNKGLNFTAQVLFPQELCYDQDDKGEDYLGGTDLSENYEECLPWVDTVGCYDFPTGIEGVFLLLNGGNQCRNPGGKLLQPWCYTYKDGANCRKRYCDACNEKAPEDVVADCDQLIAADPELCMNAIQRFGCFKECGYQLADNNKGTCGPPPLPSDGTLNGTPKATYQEGEKVTVSCSDPNFPQSTYNIMVCTGNGWTELTYACDYGCRTGWMKYGDRCFYYTSVIKKYSEAQADCKAFGSTGTQFEVRDVVDQEMLAEYRVNQGLNDYTWLNGNRGDDNVWRFTDTTTEMTYFNWSSSYSADLNDVDQKCILLFPKWWGDRANGWRARHCETSDRASACQLDFEAPTNCADKFSESTCQNALASFPGFCTDTKLEEVPSKVCRKSCGWCGDFPVCEDPSGATYSRVSANITAKTGEVMTFACNSDYYHTSGDLSRACSFDGTLLGEEPVCSPEPVATDVNVGEIRRRKTTLVQKEAILLDHDGLRVPFDGKITKWFYYCDNPGKVYFLVYRKNSNGGYDYIGHNDVVCVADWPWELKVPAADQIPVQEGDIIGLFSKAGGTISINDCNWSSVKLMNNPRFKTSSISNVQNHHFDDGQVRCSIPSVAFRMEPIALKKRKRFSLGDA